MVMDSSQIAAMAGGFNQQVTMGMQHSSMISQQTGGYAPMPGIHPVPTAGENLTGQLMQAGGNMGMQALSGRAATQGMGGLAAIPSGIGRNVLGQMMYGVQQQQGMDAMMRQSFRPQNQFGGIGFSSTQLGGMQSTMRGMSQERGEGGERTTFEELGQLASNMGRMGYAENIRGVKDFNEKFREMLKAVKHVATELNTSLEEAQKMMASMRGVGVFGAGNQSKMLGSMRQGVMAGGAFGSVAEMTSGMNVGSQMARSIGGRGRHGAMAGYQAAAQTSVMRNMGVLSEEDIYDVTGMEGVAGRQAYAQQKLQSDASFLRGRHGRVMLAAMMGEDGNLDPNAMQKIMSGGEAATDYMARGRQNLAKSGTMGFLRNEGELRGQAMALGGGNVRAAFYRGELEKRGLDVSGGGDRPMLALQKIGKMNKQQAEMSMKEIRNLDQMSSFKESVAEDDMHFRELEQRHRQASPEALAREVEEGKQKLNDTLRDFGAGVYKAWSSRVNQYVKKMSGEVDMQASRSLTGAMRAWDMGGDASSRIERMYLGGGGGAMGVGGALSGADISFSGGGMSDKQFGRTLSGRHDEIRAAGYDPTGIQNRQQFEKLRQQNMEFLSGKAPDSFDVGGINQTFDQAMGDRSDVRRGLLETFSAAPIGGKNEQFVSNFESAIAGRPELQGVAVMLQGKSMSEKAGIIKKLAGKSGMQNQFGGRFAAVGGMGGGGMGMDAVGAALGADMGTVDLQGIVGGTNAQGGMAAGPQEFRGVSNWLSQAQGMAGQPGQGGGALGWMRKQAMGLEDTLWNDPVVDESQTAAGRSGLRERVRSVTGIGSRMLTEGVLGKGGLSKIPGLGGASRWLADRMRPFEESVAAQVGGQAGLELTDTQKEALGNFAAGEEFYGQMGSLLSGNKEVSEKAMTQVMTRQAELNKKFDETGGKLGEGDLMELSQLKMMRATKERMEFIQRTGRQPTAEDAVELGRKVGMGADAFQSFSTQGQRGLATRQQENRRQFADKLREGAEQEIKRSGDIDLEGLKKSGKIGEDAYQAALLRRERAGIRAGYRTDRSGASEDFLEQEMGVDVLGQKLAGELEGIGEGGGPGSMIGLGGGPTSAGVGGARAATEKLNERYRGKSASEIRKMVKEDKLTGMGRGRASMLEQRADITERLGRSRGRGRGEAGATATTAGFFGVQMSRKEAKGMSGDEFAGTMMGRMGLRGDQIMNMEGVTEEEKEGMGAKQEEMEKALSEMKGMKGSKRAEAMQAFQTTYQKEITAGARGNQDEKARKEDPLFRALEALPEKLGEKMKGANKEVVTGLTTINTTLGTVNIEKKDG